MIKVLIAGTPIYKLCFARRKYKTLKKHDLTAGELINRINDESIYAEGDEAQVKKNVADVIRSAFESKPLYETTALIFMADAKRGEPPVATAVARQSRKDDNQRSTGREVALGRLLRTKDTPPFTAPERDAIRKAYDDRFKVKPKRTPPPASAGSAPVAQVREASHSVVSKVIPFAPVERRYQFAAA